MRRFCCTAAVLAASLCFPVFTLAQKEAGKPRAAAPGVHMSQKLLDEAMDPGAGQKKLAPLVGTFDVKVRTWASPSAPPVEFSGVNVNAWVLGDRFLQLMFSTVFEGELISSMSYIGYNNVAKRYEMASMDTGGTDIQFFTGNFDPSGTHMTLKASIYEPGSAKPSPVELRVTTQSNGDHAVEFWGAGPDGKLFDMMQLKYTRKQ